MSTPVEQIDELVGARTERDVVLVTGEDSAEYLQGQLSQDVVGLPVGESAWSLLLQPRGKVDSWFRVSRTEEDSFLLDVDAGYGELTVQRLERFKLRTSCEFALESWSIVSLRGPGASGFEAGAVTEAGPTLAAPAEWPGIDGVDLIGRSVQVPPHVTEISDQDLDRLRICAGVPAMGAELTEETIPAEAGIVDRSVSFTKGCYVGQELVARIDSRGGNVPRRLCGVVGEAGLSVDGPVVVDGDEVGQTTSVQDRIGLAYVKRAVENLPVEATVGGVVAEIRELPML